MGGGGQAFPVPQKIQPGFGRIHNMEKEAGICGKIKFIQSYYRNLLRSDF
ncbi:hypothetical protein P9155_22330 [Bacillus cereus]|nr:hypothetical protein [Bacillus thuringiensis]MEC3432463.1 hypothetical protein [Bacillus cereus]